MLKVKVPEETAVDTGKDPEGEKLIAGNLEVTIERLVVAFKKEIPRLLPRQNKLEVLRLNFVNYYNMNRLLNMKKDEYVVGLGRKDTFCYRIENELQELGDIHGSTSAKFGLYYGKSGEDTEEKYRHTNKFGDNPDDALEKIKEQIIYLRMDGEKLNLDGIRKNMIAPIYRGKILSVYFPEEYLCIFADEHLEYFMLKLDIDIDIDDDILSKQLKLMDWMKSRNDMKDWSNIMFCSFLYHTFGHPFEEGKENKDVQAERDKEYPRDFVSSISVTINQWKELLQNPNVFTEKNIALMKRFYLADNHACTCYDLGIEDGVSPSTYIKPVVALARRISAELGLDPVFDNEGNQTWWRIPFWGSYREDSRFEWKLRPKLAKAMAAAFPELGARKLDNIEDQEDDNLVSALKQATFQGALDDYEYEGKPKKKQVPIYSNGYKVYSRDRQTAINALAHAHYECECQIGNEHPTFVRRNSDKNYTEPHHLVPMSETDQFEVSLDVEENIVSLCSNCHNKIHYGRDAKGMIIDLYQSRKASLENVGIYISLESLLKIYKVSY